jgi:Tfp pilus assembly protein PilV
VKARQSGLSYIEVLVATLLIAVALVPMMEALGPGLQGSEIHRESAEVHFALTGKLEAVLAQPFGDLDAAAAAAGDYKIATSYSDLAAAVPHEVFIWRYDVDNADGDGNVFTGGEDDVLWVRVATVDALTDLQTLISRY